METKLEQVSNLFDQTALDVSKSPEKWTAFLDTAAQMYKYGVDEQSLIHAQRPDATACAAISVWNKLKRWVKRGTKGIALLDQGGNRPRLKYVFDMSDTQAGRGGKDVRLWQLGAEHMEAVDRVLDANFGVKPDPDLAATLLKATAGPARENCRVYWNDLMKATYQARKYYHKAQYTLDRDDGIEDAILHKEPSAEDTYERESVITQIVAAISALPQKQAQRIYACYFGDISEAAIAKAEGVSKQVISASIRDGLRNIKKILESPQNDVD